ncbi:MAG: hypothetical protein QNJ63_24515, partial [Calothrix sp. MO_192.B10]|nr:hypothetical protein [Calothrix sp. MO_192.B10]
MPGNPFGLRHLLYAGEPFRQLLHLGRPQDRTASPPQWLTVHRTASFMPGNPFGLRHLLYAGEPVHRSGLPSTAL